MYIFIYIYMFLYMYMLMIMYMYICMCMYMHMLQEEHYRRFCTIPLAEGRALSQIFCQPACCLPQGGPSEPPGGQEGRKRRNKEAPVNPMWPQGGPSEPPGAPQGARRGANDGTKRPERRTCQYRPLLVEKTLDTK